MPYQFTIKGKDYQIPFMDELSMADFIKLSDCKTDKDKLDLFFDTDTATIPADLSKPLALVDVLEKEITEWLTKKDKPADNITVQFFDKPLKFNKDLGKLEYWPMTKVKAIIKQMGDKAYNEHTDYPDLVGHYLYTKATGNPYNEYRAQEFVAEIEAMPFTMVIRLGDFFLYMLRYLWMPKSDCLKAKSTLKKSMRELKYLTSTAI